MLNKNKKLKKEIKIDQGILKLHDEAVEKGEAFYLDPNLGLYVATYETLKTQDKCCLGGCRHCPWRR